ncbi:MAG: response regulator [Oligoflexales bacterium]|nr:response regulator [Oligoflexales bacterium]
MDDNRLKSDIFRENEIASNLLTAKSLIAASLIIPFVSVILYFEFLPIEVKALKLVIVIINILTFLPTILIFWMKKQDSWVKYFIVTLVAIALGLANMTSANRMGAIWCLIFIMASFYFSVRLTIYSSVLTALTIIISELAAISLFPEVYDSRWYEVPATRLIEITIPLAFCIGYVIRSRHLVQDLQETNTSREKALHQLQLKQDEVNVLNASLQDLNVNLENKVKEQTDELRSANMKLKELDKEKTRFFQNISHEFRTPLTLIMNPLENLARIFTENADIQTAIRNSKRLYRLVTQLLEFQKYSGTSKNIQLKPVNLTSLIGSISSSFAPICRDKEIDFEIKINEINLNPELGNDSIYINGNIDALEKIVFNFLSNAYKFIDKSGEIFLKLCAIQDRAVISVSDNGIGISEEDQRLLFNVFHQVESSKKSGVEGTGLGLALTKELTEKMDGKVEVSSGLGKGSIFSVSFPLLRVSRPIVDALFVFDIPSTRDSFKTELSNFTQIQRHLIIEDILQISEIKKRYLFKSMTCELKDFGKYDLSALSLFHKDQPGCRIIFIGDNIVESLALKLKESKIEYSLVSGQTCYREIIGSILNFIMESKVCEPYSTIEEYSTRDWLMPDMDFDREKNDIVSELADDGKSSEKETVLLVDDVIDLARLMAQYLAAEGYRVSVATDGKSALEKCLSDRPDLVITDWMMPGMSGIDLIKWIRNNKYLSSVPIIMLTAKDEEESRREAVGFGADGYLGKPFDYKELISTVKNLINLKKGEKKIADLNRELSDRVLKRFLPPNLVDDILAGKTVFDTNPQHTMITVLILSICDFGKIFEIIGPENISVLLNEYFSEMTQIAFSHESIVDRFEDGSIRIIFGITYPDDSRRQSEKAALCAFAMMKRMSEMTVKWKKEYDHVIGYKIAIHSGQAIVGNIGSPLRSDYTAIGHAVIAAKKLESLAKEGEIIISERVRNFMPEGCKWTIHGRYKLDESRNEEVVSKLIEVNPALKDRVSNQERL